MRLIICAPELGLDWDLSVIRPDDGVGIVNSEWANIGHGLDLLRAVRLLSAIA
jgi:hypothetical protein